MMNKTANGKRMPVLFVGHGNPMNAIEENEFRRTWEELGRKLPKPKAILCISAHWETHGVHLTSSAAPGTIHDFYGFPKALFDAQYPAPGDPALAIQVSKLLDGVQARLDPDRGLDHGVWSVLLPMYPAADIPIVQLSLEVGHPGTFHYNLGKKLAPLRDEGVLIIGSGNMVHNLGIYSYHEQKPYPWAIQFNDELKSLITAREHEQLIRYETSGMRARLAIPTPEHYLPMLYAIALQEDGETVSFFNDEVTSSISMTSILIGAE
jgi:4,5-DOPA dioxygenase extradiol